MIRVKTLAPREPEQEVTLTGEDAAALRDLSFYTITVPGALMAENVTKEKVDRIHRLLTGLSVKLNPR